MSDVRPALPSQPHSAPVRLCLRFFRGVIPSQIQSAFLPPWGFLSIIVSFGEPAFP